MADPYNFDCSECELGVLVDCPLRSDGDLRHYKAAERERWSGARIVDAAKAGDLLARAAEVIRRQGMPVPVAIISEILGIDAFPSDVAELRSALKRSPDVQESANGLYDLIDPKVAPRLEAHTDLSEGAQLEDLVFNSHTLEAEEQRRLLKRRKALGLAGGSAATLNQTVDQLLDVVLAERGWSLHDIDRYSRSGQKIPEARSEPAAKRTSSLLAAVYALDFVKRLDWRSEYDAISDRLVRANLRLVARIAGRFARGRGISFADLFDHGVLGLLRAMETYDPYLGYELSTYATWWITQKTRRAIADEGSLVRVPVHAHEAVYHNRHRALGDKPDFLPAARAALLPVMPWSGAHPDRAQADAAEWERSELRTDLTPLLALLEPNELVIIRARCGFDDAPETLQEIGDRLGITRERVRQLESRGLRRIRRVAEAQLPDDVKKKSATNEQPGGTELTKGRKARRKSLKSDIAADEAIAKRDRHSLAGRKHVPVGPAGPPSGLRPSALLSVDMRVAQLGQWEPSMGFVPAPDRFGPEVREVIERSRRSVLASKNHHFEN